MRKLGLALLIIGVFSDQLVGQSIDDVSVFATVDYSVKLREWDGFGVNYVQNARSNDYKNNPQDYGGFSFLNEKQRKEITEYVFGDNGLKPAIVKMFLDPIHQIKPCDKFDHSTSTKWMRQFVKDGLALTRKRGEDLTIITTLYGPPAWATIQKQLNSRDIDTTQFRNVAAYLVDWLKWLKNEEKIPVKYISLHNEADKPVDWNKEGTQKPEEIFDYNSYWSPTQIVKFINILRPILDENGLQEIGITPGECSSWWHFRNRQYDWEIVRNSDALKNLSLVTSHSFGGPEWATPGGVSLMRLYKPGIHSWVTSSSWGRNDMTMPSQININVSYVKVNAYIPWAVIQTPSQWLDGVDPNPASPIRVTESGSYDVTPVYSFYKQFTAAGRPGMSVVPTTTTSNTDVEIIGFGKDDTAYPNSFVVTYKHDWGGDRKTAIKILGHSGKKFRAYRTYRKYGVTALEEFKDLGFYQLKDGYLYYNAPAHSVTTFIAED